MNRCPCRGGDEGGYRQTRLGGGGIVAFSSSFPGGRGGCEHGHRFESCVRLYQLPFPALECTGGCTLNLTRTGHRSVLNPNRRKAGRWGPRRIRSRRQKVSASACGSGSETAWLPTGSGETRLRTCVKSSVISSTDGRHAVGSYAETDPACCFEPALNNCRRILPVPDSIFMTILSGKTSTVARWSKPEAAVGLGRRGRRVISLQTESLTQSTKRLWRA